MAARARLVVDSSIDPLNSHTALFSFYVRVFVRVLFKSQRGLVFLAALGMHAIGHAFVAWVAGAVALSLAGIHPLAPSTVSDLPGIPPVGFASSILDRTGSSLLGGDGTALEAAYVLTFAGVAAVTLKSLGGVYASYVQAHLSGDIGRQLRLRVLEALLNIRRTSSLRQSDPNVPSRMPSMEAVASLTSRIGDVEAGADQGAFAMVRSGAQLMALAILLGMTAPRLALFALGVFLPLSFLIRIVRGRFKRMNRDLARQNEALLQASDEAAKHAELWISYGAEQRVRTGIDRIGRELSDLRARAQATVAAASGLNEVLGAAALVITIGAVRMGWLNCPPGALVAFMIPFFLAYRPLRDLAEGGLVLTRARSAFEELQSAFGPMDHEPETTEEATSNQQPSKENPSKTTSHDAVADRLRRSWPLAHLSVRDLQLPFGNGLPIAFELPAGQILAVVGSTGSGKTTLLRCLLGFAVPREGSISYNGSILENGLAGPEKKPFAWVPQDAPVIADTLEANVQLGGARDVSSLLGDIGAQHLHVDDRARLRLDRELSGGERQWVGIARALATDLPVLLLDEPTSGLDGDAQASVLAALSRLKGRRSVIVVTHRREVLAIADQVLDIAPSDSHEERTALRY